MSNYIFICYNGGAGGEQLALRVSQLDKCYTLKYQKWKDRTMVESLNHWLQLEQGQGLTQTDLKEKYHVIPTVLAPEHIPYEGFRVVINFPTEPALIKEVKQNAYNKIWCYNGMSFANRLEEYQRHGTVDSDVYEMIKDSDCTYGQIYEKTRGMNWDTWWDSYMEETFSYKNSENLLAIDYQIPQPIEIIEQINSMI